MSRLIANPAGGWALASLLLLAALPSAVAAQDGDAFLCYRSKPARGAPRFLTTTVSLSDELEGRDVDVRGPRRLCIPVDLGGGIADPAIQLVGYKVRPSRTSPPYPADEGVQVVDAVGDFTVDRKPRPKLLLVPSSVDASTVPSPPDDATHGVDHYRCHDVKPSGGRRAFPAGLRLAVGGPAPAAADFDLKRVLRLCDPVAASAAAIKQPASSLLCYRAKRLRGEPKPQPARGLHTNNELGPASLDALKEVELCLPARAIARCNGSRLLCDRAYDAVSYPTTHNAMSNAEEGWIGPNQDYSITHQLEDGVRALMLDTWYFGGQVVLCHGGDVFPCDLTGMKPLVDGLAEIKTFLDRHPNEVVSIIFESYVSEADVLSAFMASGLLSSVHVQSAADPWPSLRDLILADTRLVVFTDDSAASLPWHLYVWDFAWETHFSFATPQDFTCTRNRGSAANSLFILNHFLTKVVGSPLLADMVNHNPLFIDRAEQCQSESGRLPNFVTVDFYDIGDLFAVVDSLNGVAP